MTNMPSFDEFKADLDLLDDWEDRYRALIDLGRQLDPMPEALKTDATKVRGCSSQVWLFAEPAETPDTPLHLLGDSDALIVRGLVALLFLMFNGRTPEQALALDARAELEEIGLARHLSPTRTNGLFSMVARIGELARARAGLG